MDAARISTVFFVAALSFLASGCASTDLSPRETFLRAHSAERLKYESICEVSPESLLDACTERYRAQESLVRSLKKDFSKYPDLVERLDAVENRLAEFSKQEQKGLREMQKEFDPMRDTLFSYVHLDGTQEEDGWMIVRENRIRKKYVLSTGERYLQK